MENSALLYVIGIPIASIILGGGLATKSGNIFHLLLLNILLTAATLGVCVHLSLSILMTIFVWLSAVVFLELSWLAVVILGETKRRAGDSPARPVAHFQFPQMGFSKQKTPAKAGAKRSAARKG